MSRGNLFAKVAHAERMVEAFEEPPPPRLAPPSPPPRSTPPLPEPAALATAAARVRRPKPKVTIAVPPRPPLPGHAMTLEARTLKVSLALDPARVAAIPLPKGKPALALVIAVGGRRIQAKVNGKGLRKTLGIIGAHGADNVVVKLQGALEVGDVLAAAGFATTVKAKVVPAADEA